MEKKTQNNQHSKDAKGYCYNKRRGKFQASIQVNRRVIYLGNFEKEEDARTAYLDAKDRYSYYLERPR